MQGLLAQSVVHLIGSSLTGIDCERVQTLSGHILLTEIGNLTIVFLIQVVVLEQDTFTLAKYWFNLGRPVPV